MSLAQKNLSRVNTKIKQSVSHAFRTVTEHPDSMEAVKYLRTVAGGLKTLATGLPLTKTELAKDDYVDRAAPKLARFDKAVAGGFVPTTIKAPKDAKLKKLASTQIRNTIRPVSYLQGIKKALNAKTPNYADAAEQLNAMADSLEVGVQLKSGNETAARRRVSSLIDRGYVPSSVQKHLVH